MQHCAVFYCLLNCWWRYSQRPLYLTCEVHTYKNFAGQLNAYDSRTGSSSKMALSFFIPVFLLLFVFFFTKSIWLTIGWCVSGWACPDSSILQGPSPSPHTMAPRAGGMGGSTAVFFAHSDCHCYLLFFPGFRELSAIFSFPSPFFLERPFLKGSP